MRPAPRPASSCCVHHSGSVRPAKSRNVSPSSWCVLVEAEDPQQRLVELPVRDLLDARRRRSCGSAPEAAADADVHRLDELAVDLLEHALDADVGDLVLRAARRAAREVQAEVLAVAVRAHVLVEELGDLDRAALGVDLGQAAELLAGAGLQAALEERRGGGEVVRPAARRAARRRSRSGIHGSRTFCWWVRRSASSGVGAVLAREPRRARTAARPSGGRPGTTRPTVRCAPSVCGEDADVVLAARGPGPSGRRGAAARPTRRSSSSRSASAPTRSTRNFRRALPRAFRFSSESRKIAGHARRSTSGASSGVTKTSIQRAKRGWLERPPPTRRLKPRVPSSRDRAGQRDVVDQAARAVLGAAGDRDLVLAREVRVELVVEEVARGSPRRWRSRRRSRRGARPASVQPTTLRVMSPQAPEVVMPDARRGARRSRGCSSSGSSGSGSTGASCSR